MQNTTFYALLRQYVKQAQRRGVSYADQVNEIVRLRVATINAGDDSPEQKERQIASARSAAEREYKKHDPAFVLVGCGVRVGFIFPGSRCRRIRCSSSFRG